MKTLFAFLALSLSLSQAQAASYKVSFTVQNPGVSCQDETLSRFSGRDVSLGHTDLRWLSLAVQTQDGSAINTDIRDLSAVESKKQCATLNATPSVLKGQRVLSIVRQEDHGRCNAYVYESISISLGKGNPVLSGTTAYPVVGDDFSAWSADLCKLGETDFAKAIQRIVGPGANGKQASN